VRVGDGRATTRVHGFEFSKYRVLCVAPVELLEAQPAGIAMVDFVDGILEDLPRLLRVLQGAGGRSEPSPSDGGGVGAEGRQKASKKHHFVI